MLKEQSDVANQISAEIFTRIDVLSEKLGMGLDAIWPHMVERAYSVGWLYLSAMIFIAAGCVIFPILSVRSKKSRLDSEAALVTCAVVYCFTLLIFVFTTGASVVERFTAPETVALSELIEMIR